MRLLKRSQVAAMVGLERSAIYAKLRAHQFPQPIRLGPKSVRWIEEEVRQWIENKAAAREGGQ